VSVSGKRVLIVEDDADIRGAVCDLLADAGYVPATAANGAEAIDRLNAGPAPDLILLDLMMPIMDGFTFRIRQSEKREWAAIPVVVMSAAGRGAENRVQDAGAYLRKPIDIDELLGVIKKLTA
jgi:CheY-like chemotaxis protein